MENQTGSKLEKEYNKAIYCHPAYIIYMHIMQNAVLDETEAGIKTARRNINNLRYANNTTLMAEKQRGTEESLEGGERGE